MPYEAEIQTDRMARRTVAGKDPTRVTRLGTREIMAALRTDEKGKRFRVDIITYIKGWHLTLVARVYQRDGATPDKSVTLIDNVNIDRLFVDEPITRRSAAGRVLPALLQGEPDLTD